MRKGLRRLTAVLSLITMAILMTGCSDKVIVLNPKGAIGKQQLDLMIISTALCLVVIVPVLILTFYIVWKYRHQPDRKAKYDPNWEHSTKLETIWWSIPIVIIVILAAITVKYTYLLEPSKPLEHEAKPLVIQVTSLDWKWLFQYPEQGIATVNYIQFPANVPIRFELTSDAPMNSFWIPQLGGQIYTMSGMAMKLNLIADEPGSYLGMGANFSGREFGKMQFTAEATSQEQFDAWVQGIKGSSPALTKEGYEQLAIPGVSEVESFSSIPAGLFQQIVTKYGGHNHGSGSGEGATEHHHGSDSGEADATDKAPAMDMNMDMGDGASMNHEGHMNHE
ncbi:ubiquinol oxidase subunit II [Cohnella silvisoli]|uniref:Quinol oxidase subunit 2 n=1 Tax=Cohnella silvisoli TaxID=2873699 RepID=A0ABV1KPZ4_9BACL|nr:ubiquinol oxidase subunit II [Cohnella silvisoli]MCD9022202.1 ubiquinol oxidase subunit II [Cohnella silvisoli]